GIIDRLVPELENQHEPVSERSLDFVKKDKLSEEEKLKHTMQLKRMGLFSALAIAIHNFPEGLATFASALSDPALGLSIAIAIAIHNIPEGISVSVPLYYATGSKKKAFGYSFLSGLAEPIGALIGYFIFRTFFNDLVFGILFGAVAGIMVYISIDELLPTSRKYGKEHQEIYGFVAGMAVMSLSLLLF
ncbi:MAG: zinc transporter ZupT, partial [bacterium]